MRITFFFRQTIVRLIALGSLASCSTHKNFYSRAEWKHWIDEDADCKDTRAEILTERSEIPAKIDPQKCKVLSGRWNDYYFSEILLRTSDIDIDHLVPLKHAHEAGGAAWSAEEKKRFANDPRNLVVTNRKYNRKKGEKTPLEWLPIERRYACKYWRDWMTIKSLYKLEISSEERTEHVICQKVLF
jgi:hypothetical protein